MLDTLLLLQIMLCEEWAGPNESQVSFTCVLSSNQHFVQYFFLGKL